MIETEIGDDVAFGDIERCQPAAGLTHAPGQGGVAEIFAGEADRDLVRGERGMPFDWVREVHGFTRGR